MQGITGEVRTNSSAIFFYELPRMDTPVLADQQRLAYIKFCEDT